MKKTIAILFAILFLPALALACTGGASQLIFRIDAATNAHAQLYNSLPAYPIEICYDTIFGAAYSGASPHTGNTILRASAATNAHVATPTFVAYTAEIKYGNLVCEYKANCTGQQRCIITISGASNAMVARCSSPAAYPTKVCCSSAAIPPPASCGNGALDPNEECDGAIAAACAGEPCKADCTCGLPACATDGICDGICPLGCAVVQDPDCQAAGCCGDGKVPDVSPATEECDDGHSAGPIAISDCTNGPNGLRSIASNLSADYFLTADIDCTGVAFTPIGTAAAPFTGTLDGQGHKISNLSVSGSSRLGLFGVAGTGSELKNIELENVTINGSYLIGALAGQTDGSVTNCYASGTVTGNTGLAPIGGARIGGLVGIAGGNSVITNCRFSGTVNATSNSGTAFAGGLVGFLEGTVRYSFSEGTVRTKNFTQEWISTDLNPSGVVQAGGVGGLVGNSLNGLIIESYSTANVDGSDNSYYVGGLAGQAGDVYSSYATGNVSGVSYVGGLVGKNGCECEEHPRTWNSYATGNVTAANFYAGGLVGFNAHSIESSYATGDVRLLNAFSSSAGGLIGRDFVYGGVSVKNTYSIGLVSGPAGAAYIGALEGSFFDEATGTINGSSGICTSSYWNPTDAGVATSACGTQRTQLQMNDPTTVSTVYVDWDFSRIWNIDASNVINSGYPYLRGQFASCGDNICEFPLENVFNCPEDCAKDSSCPGTCQAGCSCGAASPCGNGVIDGTEECDDGSLCEDLATDCTGNPSACALIGTGTCAPRGLGSCSATCSYNECDYPGLLGYWTFDRGTGTTAHDYSMNSNEGALRGTPAWVAGHVGPFALDFERSNNADFVEVTGTGSYQGQVGTGFSVSAWAKFESSAAQQAIAELTNDGSTPGDSFRNVFLLTRWTSNDAWFITEQQGSGATPYIETPIPNENTWYFVVITWDGATKRIYVNGVEEETGSWAGPLANVGVGGQNSFNIGADKDLSGGNLVPGDWFDGTIDDVAFFNRALTNTEIQNMFNGGDGIYICSLGAGPSCSSLIAVPASDIGPFDSTLAASFVNVSDGTTINFDCGNGSTGSGTVSSGSASFTCSYPAVAAATTYTVSAVEPISAASCTATTVTVNPPLAGQGLFKIIQFNALPLSFQAPDPLKPNEFSFIDVRVKNISSLAGRATVELVVLDPQTDLPLAPPVSPPISAVVDCGLIAADGVCTLTAASFKALDISALPSGAYKLTASAKDSGGAVHDKKSLFFTIANPTPVPELDAIMIPLLAFSVLAVLFFSSKRKG